jgi:DNA-binding transcriptional LysR family regulator
MEAQSMLILSGHYIGFLPRHIGDSYAERGLLRVLRPEIYGFESQHFAAMRKREANSALLRAFVPELKRQARTTAVRERAVLDA